MIEVEKTPFGTAIWSLVRQIALILGGWAIGRGYLEHDTALALGSIGTILFPLVYGQVKGWKLHKHLLELARYVPDTVARVKGE